MSEENKELIIHVVCHTHDDPGWLWTLDDYYMGTDHCKVSVKRILDNMVVSLTNKKDRKFSYVEMSYFKKWYDSQTDKIKQTVKDFIKEGRLEIINGGWVMHDEAGTYYKHLIDNMRIGLKFLKEEFNITPRIGWFIDPFGHSSATSHILSQMNFEKIVLTRIDYLEKKDRIDNHNLEFIYDPFGLGQKIFTHISYHHYNPRKILRNYPGDKKIELSEEELKDVCEKYYEEMVEERVGYRTNNLLLYYGEDFSFNEADINYENIEMIMNYVNKNMKGKMKMIYSTPSQYFESVLKSGAKFDTHSNYDFFPYADNAHCYWTGYFSSRANLKGLIKQLGLYVNITNRLLFEIFTGNEEKMKSNKKIIKKSIDCIYFAREKLGVLQHHDAVTGTSKEKTNKDYENMAIVGVEKLKKYIYLLVNILGGIEKPYDISCGYEEVLTLDNQIEEDNNFVIINPNLNEDHFFNYRLNIFKKDDKNSYEFKIKEGDHIIFGNNIAFNDVEIGLRYSSLQFNSSLEKNNLFVGLSITRTNKIIEKKYFSNLKEEKININNGELIFDCETLKFIKDKNEFSLSHGYYTSYDGSNSKVRPEKSNPDGAYIFAPCENELQRYKSIDKNKSFYQQNKHYTSIVLRYPNSYLIIIVQNNNLNIYTESIFDPISRKTDTAYNYLLVLDSNINNINEEYKQPEIFTDSQGINMMKRIKDTRPNYKYELTEKVSSNFYPITSVVSLHETNNKKNKVSIYSDRAQSAGFLDKGQIQLICQRFSNVDDWKGVGEGLYENSSMDRFFPVKHVISFHDKNYSDYFNKVPFILSVENTEKYKVNSNLDKIITLDDTIDVEFEAKKYGEIFIEVGNVFCDYYNEYGKENENIKFNYENGKIIEYNLNGVDEIKNIKNGEEISIKKQMFKSFLLQRNLSK